MGGWMRRRCRNEFFLKSLCTGWFRAYTREAGETPDRVDDVCGIRQATIGSRERRRCILRGSAPLWIGSRSHLEGQRSSIGKIAVPKPRLVERLPVQLA